MSFMKELMEQMNIGAARKGSALHLSSSAYPQDSGGRGYALGMALSRLENFMKIEIVHCPT
jgi:hypothetical protein